MKIETDSEEQLSEAGSAYEEENDDESFYDVEEMEDNNNDCPTIDFVSSGLAGLSAVTETPIAR